MVEVGAGCYAFSTDCWYLAHPQPTFQEKGLSLSVGEFVLRLRRADEYNHTSVLALVKSARCLDVSNLWTLRAHVQHTERVHFYG